MLKREQLQETSKWVGFVGVMTIIFGALSALSGLFAFVVGAIPGIIMIILGVKLRNVKKEADRMLAMDEADEASLYDLFENLNTYFKIQGILIIVSLVMFVIGFITSFGMIFALMSGGY
ncbi:MAG: DUF5362 family protein [Halanaerobiales bacterium]